jgi:serine/threonine protein kinase
MFRPIGFAERRAPNSLFELMPGLEIGPADRRFYLDDELAGGPLACWWKARDLALEDQDFDIHYKTLKVIAPHLGKDQALLGWLQQAVAQAAELTHPHIATVYHWARGEDGWSYVVQEYLEGQDLGLYLLKHGPLDSAAALDLLQPLADALDYAWRERSLLHGNLRPETVLISEDGALKLLDFGLTPANLRSQLEGAADYAPPEASTTPAASQAQDIFALACIAYEMLVGQSPFGIVAKTLRRNDHEQRRPRHLTSAAWAVLRQALASDPRERPTSSTLLVAALQATQ